MIEQAMKLLYSQYDTCMDVVKNDKFHSYYAEEKIRHSLQVAGAGNYLVRHIEWLKNKPEEYVDMVRTAVLLHDVCRFSEIADRFRGVRNYDHGVAAYEFLRYTPLFNDIRIRLPIKHHGHLIRDLYADAEYQSLDSALQQEVERICFVIRDADKIANFNLVTHEPYFLPLFFDLDRETKDEDFMISDTVRANAFVEDTIPFPINTIADRAAAFLSWYMDINYQAAIDYCQKLGVTELMFAMFAKYCKDAEFKAKYAEFVRGYLQKHKFTE